MWVYLVIAFVVLPVFVPAATLAFEPNARRRWRMTPFVALGAAVSIVLFVALVRTPIDVEAQSHHLAYRVSLSHGGLVVALYVAAVCGALLFSVTATSSSSAPPTSLPSGSSHGSRSTASRRSGAPTPPSAGARSPCTCGTPGHDESNSASSPDRRADGRLRRRDRNGHAARQAPEAKRLPIDRPSPRLAEREGMEDLRGQTGRSTDRYACRALVLY